jgi:hypothetical protein
MPERWRRLESWAGKMGRALARRRACRWLFARLRWMVAFALVAVGFRLTLPAPPEATEAGVAAMLGAAIEGEVAAEGFVWEPSGGAFADLLLGRQVVFLGRRDGTRDLHRARVRVSREGKPLSVREVRNLTQTTLGDEDRLIALGRRVAFVTRAFGAVQGVTVLDLDGAPLGELGAVDRWLVRLDNWLETGSLAGLSRTEIAFHTPPTEAEIELRADRLVLALGDPPRPAALDLSSATLNTGGDDTHRARAWRSPPRVKPPLHFAMDALRNLLGTELADSVKAVLFGARGRLVRIVTPAAEPATIASDAVPMGAWPPQPIAPLFAHPLEGEGIWAPPSVDFLEPLEGAAPGVEPHLLQTIVRPDPAQPFAAVRLVAIDTRQLALHIEAGFDEPRPLTGPRGAGRIPAALEPRVAASFNGAFQTRHGEYGMVVDGRILLPPKNGAATFAVDVHGRPRAGTWRAGDEVPADIVSLRQNLDPLIDGGRVNPAGRKQWGFPLDGGSFLTERSALCRTKGGHLVYGWGIELGAETLAGALVLAGCDHAMHLDMNPGHVGFVFHGRGQSALLAPEMSIPANRFLRASPKDFFYLVRRQIVPTHGGLAWKAADGEHPPPAWLPALHVATTERLGVEVTVYRVDLARYAWAISPGSDERAGRTASGVLTPAEQARAMLALGLGVGLRKDNRRGLVIDGVAALPIRPDLGVVTTTPEGRLDLARSIERMAPEGDATELPLLVEGGDIRVEARKLRERRLRSAACQLDDGELFVAMARSDNVEPPTRALLDLGCTRIVELDRGNQNRSFFHRAGTPDPPEADYPDTVIYGMSRVAPGRALPLD